MFAVIYIPDFSLQAALRHEPELFLRPVALIDGTEKNASISQITQSARGADVCEGLTSTQALARCPNLIFKTRSATPEMAANEILHQCACCFSPHIEATALGICTLDLKNLNNAGDKIWAEKIIAQLALLNLRAQLGIAETPDLALQAARIARPFFLVENAREFISSLPVEIIDPPPGVLNILNRWGIRTLGEFTSLQKDKLAERLGPDALELFDRASAKAARPLNLINPKEIFEEAIEFEKEVETLQPLLFILRRFIEQLSHRMELFYFVAQEIQLSLKLSSGENLERSFRVPSPTRNIETLFRMLQTHLETVQTDSPIIALHLAAKPAKPEHFQFGLFETALRDPNHFYETLAQLTSLLGSDRVGTPVVEDSFRPDSFRMEPVNFESDKHFALHISQPALSSGLALRRFRPPLRALIEMRDGKPALLNSEKFVGAIANANGPFRSSGNWWEQKQVWSRDEWDVETNNGELFRVFAQGDDWFLEGAFD